MRACFLAIAAVLVISGAGCRSMNLAKGCGCGGHDQCGGGCDAGSCSQGVGGHSECGNGICRHGHRGHGHLGHGGGLLGHGGAGGHGGHLLGGHHHLAREYMGPPGPPTAQVAYPYYTTRGPRDFLLDNPPSIGR